MLWHIMALFGRQGIISGFITEICVILAIASTIRGQNQQGNCPGIQLPDAGNGTCTLSDDCTSVTCTAPPDGGPYRVLTVQVYGCQPIKARVTLELSQSSKKWSYTFEDGEETAFPMPTSSVDVPMKVMLKAVLKKTGDNLVHYKFVQLFKSDYGSYNTTFLEGDLRAASCESHDHHTPVPPTHYHHGEHQDNCPEIQSPDGSNGTCVLSDHCSKVTCKSPPDSTGPFGHMELTVQAYGCHPNLKADVHLQSEVQSGEAQSGMVWSHTFKDGEKAELPMTPPEAPPGMKIFLKVELKKNGGNTHFKLILLFESEIAPYNVTFLEGDLHASKCGDEGGSDNSKQCPAVSYIPRAKTPSKCDYADHCSRVTCVAEANGHKLTTGFEANKCKQSLKAKVTLQQPEDNLDFSHILGDGEKAKLPVTPSSFTGGIPVSDASLFVKVKLRETPGNNVNFTVWIVGQVTFGGDVSPVNVVLLQGELPVSTDDCGTWFSRQSKGVKVAVIIVPIVVIVIFVAVVVGFFCYKKRQDGTRFMVDIFPGRNKSGMQRLTDEL